MRYFFKFDPATLDDEEWVLRAKETDWIIKIFYPELMPK
jgi:hypothetical protein